MAKVVSQSAGRALGLLIAKYKTIGGMPYDVYTKLYDSLIRPIISYGAVVWGAKRFSCINAIQNRAMRFFLGTGKYTPTAAVLVIWVGNRRTFPNGRAFARIGIGMSVWSHQG